MESTSDTDQDSLSNTSEEGTFNQAHGNGGAGVGTGQYNEYQAAQMRSYMQQSGGGDQQSGQQPMMMPPGQFMPFMMPSYPMMMMQGGATGATGGRTEKESAGSPLDLQTARDDRHAHQQRPGAGGDHAARQRQAASPHTTTDMPRNSPHAGAASNPAAATGSRSGTPVGYNRDQMVPQTQSPLCYPGEFGGFTRPQEPMKAEPPKPEVPAPPKRPLTPYMRFNKCVSYWDIESRVGHLLVCFLHLQSSLVLH